MRLWQLKQRQGHPLEIKIEMSKKRVREFYEAVNGKICIAFSGGKDSTVLLHLVRSVYPKTPAIFINTGLEYPEIVAFVKTIENVITIKPTRTFREVITRFGYPFPSKEQANYIHRVRHTDSEAVKKRYLEGIRPDGRTTLFKVAEKWKFLVDAPFEVSDYCCDVLKKRPVWKFLKKAGLSQILGTMASEGFLRAKQYLNTGCNVFKSGYAYSTPLAFWMEEDIWDYIKKFDLAYSDIYNKGYDRTGCMFCMFGVHMEKGANRFQRMKKTHPRLWNYCINYLKCGEVLDYAGILHGKEGLL